MLIDHRQRTSPAHGFYDSGSIAGKDDQTVGIVSASSTASTYFIDILAAYAIFSVHSLTLSSDPIDGSPFGCIVMVLDDGPWQEVVIRRCAALKAQSGCKVICVYDVDLDDAVRRTEDLEVFVFLKADAPPGVISSAVVLANYVNAFSLAFGMNTVQPAPSETGQSSYIQAQTTLTARQTEVLRLLAKGYSNKAMARSLLLSEPTVKLHLTSLRRIFNASNRTEVLSKAMKLGFLPV